MGSIERALTIAGVLAIMNGCGRSPESSRGARIFASNGLKYCGTDRGATIECGENNVMRWTWGVGVFKQHHEYGSSENDSSGWVIGSSHFPPAYFIRQGCLVFGPYLTIPFGGRLVATLHFHGHSYQQDRYFFTGDITANAGQTTLAPKQAFNDPTPVNVEDSADHEFALAATTVGLERDVEVRVCNVTSNGWLRLYSIELTLSY